MFTVEGTNTGGTVTTYLNITVLDSLPVVTYVPSDLVLLNDSSVVDLLPRFQRWTGVDMVDFA